MTAQSTNDSQADGNENISARTPIKAWEGSLTELSGAYERSTVTNPLSACLERQVFTVVTFGGDLLHPEISHEVETLGVWTEGHGRNLTLIIKTSDGESKFVLPRISIRDTGDVIICTMQRTCYFLRQPTPPTSSAPTPIDDSVELTE